MFQILLAEDNPADVYLVHEALREHGVLCTVRTVADGNDVLRLMSSEDVTWRPDLIILDLNLPRHDGLELLRELKSGETLADVPAVVLTLSDSPRDRMTAHQLGAARYLRKPSNLKHFLELGAVFKELLRPPEKAECEEPDHES